MNARALLACLAASLGAYHDAQAVSLDPEGRGQALIYPYYTVRSAAGNPFNTLITVVNHEAHAKVLRVRFREGRNGREVASFNLYLSAYDAWAAAVVPTQLGAKLVTRDTSCTAPSMYPSADLPASQVGELAFSDASYSGANDDGGGQGPDRTREGYVEMIEMAVLNAATAALVTHEGARAPDASFPTPGVPGPPRNCFAVQSPSFSPGVLAPRGGLSGTGTLINVANGMDFTFNAEALAALTAEPFYRHYTDSYPDFDAAEVSPVSHIAWQGKQYRFTWARAVDAVSSVLMRWEVLNEFVRDADTRSATEWVLTFPTRRFYVTPTAAAPPFSRANNANCEDLALMTANREELRIVQTLICLPVLGCGTHVRTCQAANVILMSHESITTPTPVLGSLNSNEGQPAIASAQIISGWASMGFVGNGPGQGVRSEATTSVRDMRTDRLTTGELALRGLPVVGFMARTFQNGTLSCASVACQGNYGGSFGHRYRRFVTAP